jgi:hypothetical protein
MPNYKVNATRWYVGTITYEITAENEDEAEDEVSMGFGKEVSLSSPDWTGEEEFYDAEEI